MQVSRLSASAELLAYGAIGCFTSQAAWVDVDAA
jgi:hypothetical protein